MAKLQVEIRVLIIDDQKTMRSIVRQLLDQIGTRNVIEAENGQEALDLLAHMNAEETPDVIICDLHMDKLDGMEFVNTLRRSKHRVLKEIPVLILTGDTDRMVHEVTRQVGAARIMIKPISSQDLLSEINTAIGFAG